MAGKGCPKGKKKRPHTPIVSEAQRGAMEAARAAQKGETPVSKLKGPALQMYKSMKKTGPKSVRAHLQEAKGKKLPARVLEKKVGRGLKKLFGK